MGFGKGRAAGLVHADHDQDENPERRTGKEYHDAEDGNDRKRVNHRVTSAVMPWSRLPGLMFSMPLFHRELGALPMQLQCNSSARTVQLQCSSAGLGRGQASEACTAAPVAAG